MRVSTAPRPDATGPATAGDGITGYTLDKSLVVTSVERRESQRQRPTGKPQLDQVWTDFEEAEQAYSARWAKWKKRRTFGEAFRPWSYELRVDAETCGQVFADFRLDRPRGHTLNPQRAIRFAEHLAQAAAAAASGGSFFVRVLLAEEVQA